MWQSKTVAHLESHWGTEFTKMLDRLSAGRGGLLPAACSRHESENAGRCYACYACDASTFVNFPFLYLVISRPAPLHSHCRVWLAVGISKQHFAEGRFRCLCTARCSSFLLCLRTGLTWESCPRSRRTLQRQNKSCILLDLMTSTSSYDFNNLQDLTRSYCTSPLVLIDRLLKNLKIQARALVPCFPGSCSCF